jgi:hypothetical protein
MYMYYTYYTSCLYRTSYAEEAAPPYLQVHARARIQDGLGSLRARTSDAECSVSLSPLLLLRVARSHERRVMHATSPPSSDWDFPSSGAFVCVLYGLMGIVRHWQNCVPVFYSCRDRFSCRGKWQTLVCGQGRPRHQPNKLLIAKRPGKKKKREGRIRRLQQLVFRHPASRD